MINIEMNDKNLELIKEIDKEFFELEENEVEIVIEKINNLMNNAIKKELEVINDNSYVNFLVMAKYIIYMKEHTKRTTKQILNTLVKSFYKKDLPILENFINDELIPMIQEIISKSIVQVKIKIEPYINEDIFMNNIFELFLIDAINLHGLSTLLMKKVNTVEDRNNGIEMILNNFFEYLNKETNLFKCNNGEVTNVNTKSLVEMMYYLSNYLEKEYNRMLDIDTGIDNDIDEIMKILDKESQQYSWSMEYFDDEEE